jgi:DNA-binding transcriptional LysR family regulator
VEHEAVAFEGSGAGNRGRESGEEQNDMIERGMQTFLAVARFKTLKTAATRLNVSQSTASKRLQQLEEALGVILFERGKGGKSVTLTRAGEDFVSIAERFLSVIHDAKKLNTGSNAKSLSIGAVTSMNAVFMPRLYTRLVSHKPAVHVTIITLHSAEMYDEVDTRHIDVGFCLLKQNHPNVTMVPCFSEPMFGAALMESKRFHRESIPIADLDPTQEIYFPWTPEYQIWHGQNFPVNAAMIEVDDPHLLFTLMLQKTQWAIVPLSVARYFHARGLYRIFRLDPEPPERVCYKLTHRFPTKGNAEALRIADGYIRETLEQEFGPLFLGRGATIFPS